MTPAGVGPPACSDGLDTAGTSLAEDVLDAVVALLHPHQAEAEVDDQVADHVGRRRRRGPRPRPACRRAGRATRPASTSACPSSRSASGRPCTSTSRLPVACRKSVVAEDRSSRPPSSTTTWSLTRSSSPSRCEVTSTAIPNSVPIRRISAEHVVARGRVEAVGRLVEQHQPRVVHERLGELDPLLHAGRVAADRAVALLGQTDVAQHVGGALAGGGVRQPGHLAQVHDQLGGGDVGGQAVVLGHVADERRGSRPPSVATS